MEGSLPEQYLVLYVQFSSLFVYYFLKMGYWSLNSDAISSNLECRHLQFQFILIKMGIWLCVEGGMLHSRLRWHFLQKSLFGTFDFWASFALSLYFFIFYLLFLFIF